MTYSLRKPSKKRKKSNTFVTLPIYRSLKQTGPFPALYYIQLLQIFLAFKSQDDKVVCLKNLFDKDIREISHLINKTNDDLNKAIESSFEDTTLGKNRLNQTYGTTVSSSVGYKFVGIRYSVQ